MPPSTIDKAENEGNQAASAVVHPTALFTLCHVSKFTLSLHYQYGQAAISLNSSQKQV